MPEGFLCADAVLRLARSVAGGLRVNEKVIDRAIRDQLPFVATENLLMEAVKRGGDRQALHEIIRRCSMEAAAKMKNGEPYDLLARLASIPLFGLSAEEMQSILDPKLYIGRCPEQVSAFLEKVRPLLRDLSERPEEIEL